MTIKNINAIKTISIVFLAASSYFLMASVANAQIAQGDIALTWSANTYTPFDYPGKPLPVYDSVVRVNVVPLKKIAIDLAGLHYAWYLDEQRQINATGQNIQQFLFRVSTLNGNFHAVNVKIKDQEGKPVLELTTYIQIAAPAIVLFPNGQEKSGTHLTSESVILKPGQEQNFTALPYFFNIKSANELEYRWSFNNQEIIKIENPTQFSLKVGSGELTESFQRELLVYVANPRNEIQRATGRLAIIVEPEKKSTYSTVAP